MEEVEANETAFGMERSSDAGGDTVIALNGELDISSADTLRAAVEEIVAEGPRRLVFDLGGLTFMDSSGIAVMVYAANNLDEVELLHASSIIRRVVEATGLSDVLRMGPS
jgi:anti-anti-sigma factor